MNGKLSLKRTLITLITFLPLTAAADSVWQGCLEVVMGKPTVFSPDNSSFLAEDKGKTQDHLLIADEQFFMMSFAKGKPALASVTAGESTIDLAWNGKKLGLKQPKSKGEKVEGRELPESEIADKVAALIDKKFVNSKTKKRKAGDPMPADLQPCYDTENATVRKVIDTAYPSNSAGKTQN